MKITPIGNRWDDEWPYKVENPFASYMSAERAREAVAWLTSDNNIARGNLTEKISTSKMQK